MHYRNIGISILRDILAQVPNYTHTTQKFWIYILYIVYIFCIFTWKFSSSKARRFYDIMPLWRKFSLNSFYCENLFWQTINAKKKEKKESKNIKLYYNNNFLFQRWTKIKYFPENFTKKEKGGKNQEIVLIK